MSYLLNFALLCILAGWIFDHHQTKRREFQRGCTVGRMDGSRIGYENGKADGYKTGYDAAVVDCQIKRDQADRARREHNGQWKKKGA
jgi:hypothetical protein